ncbi:MAG: hypothetical protein WA190_17660 [Usitatibacter sp.]
METTAKIPRRDLELLVIGTGSDGLSGMTRLTKLLFLLEKEEGMKREGADFAFTPYKAGPYSPAIYDDIEFLENLGFIETEVTSVATAPEAAELDAMSFEALMGKEDATELAPDEYAERKFRLTEKGRKRVEDMLAKEDYQPVADKIRRVKSRFGNISLTDLLRYVYTKYPEMATESEIKDKILGRHR